MLACYYWAYTPTRTVGHSHSYVMYHNRRVIMTQCDHATANNCYHMTRALTSLLHSDDLATMFSARKRRDTDDGQSLLC